MNKIKKIYYFTGPVLTCWPMSVYASALENMQTVARGKDDAGYNIASTSIYPIVANIVGAFLALLGTIFLILIVWAGYTWMTAGGDEQKLEKAKNTIYRSVIGLLIVAGAWAITAFVLKNVPM